jgi:hypothetical protein
VWATSYVGGDSGRGNEQLDQPAFDDLGAADSDLSVRNVRVIGDVTWGADDEVTDVV